MKRSLVLLLVLAMVAMAAVLVACDEDTTGGGGGAGGASVLDNPQGMPADPSLTPQSGGTAKWILGMTLNNFGAPWGHMPGPNEYVARAVCEPLTTMDENGDRVACLATSWEKDSAAKTYTFTLREGVKFQDGTDFDADAVVWNLEKSKSENVPVLQNMVSAVATDDYTVVVTLQNWDDILLETLGSSNMMVSPAAYDLYGEDIATNPVGTGPFMFDDFVPEVSIDLVANPDYWQEGLPYLDGIRVDMVLDKQVAFASFLAGQCDYLEGPTGAQVAQAEDEGYGTLFMVSGIMGLSWDAIGADSPFANPDVREAVAMAADYDEIIDTAFGGAYMTTHQFAAKLDDVEGQGYDSGIKGYSYDEDAALALLVGAGYGPDNPIDCTFTFSGRPEETDMATLIQEALAKVGINLTLNGLDNTGWGGYKETQAAGELSAFESSYQVFMPYVSTLGQSLNPASTGWFPLQAYSDGYKALYADMVAESDLGKKADLYKQLNAMAVDELVALPLYCRTNWKLVGKNLHDMGAGQWTGEFDPSISWLEQ